MVSQHQHVFGFHYMVSPLPCAKANRFLLSKHTHTSRIFEASGEEESVTNIICYCVLGYPVQYCYPMCCMLCGIKYSKKVYNHPKLNL
jgi:hypothetical protein